MEIDQEDNLIAAPDKIRVVAGRLTVYLKIEGGASGLAKCEKLQSILEEGTKIDRIKDMQIWGVEFSHNDKENLIPSDGFCGYMAVDQLVTQKTRCANINIKEDRDRVADNLEKLLSERRTIIEGKGLNIPEIDEVEIRTK